MFYVIEGTVSFLMDDSWVDASKGAFVLAPGGVTHDFENRSDARFGFVNFSAPGDFEQRMPDIAKSLSQNGPL